MKGFKMEKHFYRSKKIIVSVLALFSWALIHEIGGESEAAEVKKLSPHAHSDMPSPESFPMEDSLTYSVAASTTSSPSISAIKFIKDSGWLTLQGNINGSVYEARIPINESNYFLNSDGVTLES